MTGQPGRELQAVLAHLAQGADAHLERLREFVAIPSISTDPAHARDVRRAAEWVAAQLRTVRLMQVEILEGGGHPAVFARWGDDPERPTVLVYGHMDVQPPDPLELWHSPPFELTERDGRWYARGISDDKASMLIPILVAQAYATVGATPPINLRFLFEAEEEIGSRNLPGMVAARRDALRCDLVLSADGGMWRADRPSITTSARGLATLELTLRGPSKDLHSGRHGGGVANPLHALAELMASLHDGGRVAVEGFYDDVLPPAPEALAALDTLPYDDEAYLAAVGAPAAFGEPGYGTLARQWYRPTLELNGMWGGYQGPGSKTVLPSEAHAKISCRLVPEQDPTKVVARVRAHLERHCPPGVTLRIQSSEHGAGAYHIAPDHPALQAAAATLQEVLGQPAELVGMGGSIPICTTFREQLGADTLFFSFSTADEDIHAPNEFYRPERFHAGVAAWARLWDRLGRQAEAYRG
ncbi:MAG TPA: dipeptidase [Trueperaceae bacterium]